MFLASCRDNQFSVEKADGDDGLVAAEKVGDFKFSPAEQAELDKYIIEHGTAAIAMYVHETGMNGDRLLEGVKYLISQGADVQRGLMGAVRSLRFDDVNIAKFLISEGANINGFGYDAPLLAAASRGRPEMVKFLVSNGADINVKDNNGNTPLDIAKKFRVSDVDVVVEYLSSLQK